MRKFYYLIGLAAAAVCLVFVLAGLGLSEEKKEPARGEANKDGLQLRISSDKNEYKIDEPVNVAFEIKNTGKQNMDIGDINTFDDGLFLHAAKIKVTGPDGKEIPGKMSSVKIKRAPHILTSGKEEKTAVDLSKYYNLKNKGEYKISFNIENTVDGWKTRSSADSNTITIKLVEKGNQPKPEEKKEPAKLKFNNNDFFMAIDYFGGEDKPFYKAALGTPNKKDDLAKWQGRDGGFRPTSEITADEVAELEKLFARPDFKLTAGNYKGGPTGKFVITISSDKNVYHLDLGFAKKTIETLREINKCLKPEHQGPINQVIGRVNFLDKK